jgi:phosphoglycolate phosphatase-like HAD superfamily hydrolase
MTERGFQDRVKDTLRNVDVIAFDWDMTIIDSHGKILQNQAIAEEFGNPLTVDEVRRHWNESTSFPDLMARLTNGADMDAIMKVVKRDYNDPEFAKRPFWFAQAALRSLRSSHRNLALVSSVQRELLETDAASVGIDLDHMFGFVQAQDDWEFKKPDARVFDPTLRHFGIDAQKLVYIGDEMKDMRAIQAAGGHFIGVETGMVTGDEFDAVGALHVPGIKEIAEYGAI